MAFVVHRGRGRVRQPRLIDWRGVPGSHHASRKIRTAAIRAKLILSREFHKRARKETTEGDVIGDDRASQAVAGPSWTGESLGPSRYAVPACFIHPRRPARSRTSAAWSLTTSLSANAKRASLISTRRGVRRRLARFKRANSRLRGQLAAIVIRCQDLRYLAKVEPE